MSHTPRPRHAEETPEPLDADLPPDDTGPDDPVDREAPLSERTSEDESSDPVGDGHSDADWADRPPAP